MTAVLVFFLYAVAAAGCALASWNELDAELARSWSHAAWLLALLAFVGPWDSLEVGLVRDLARSQGWYGWRRVLQVGALGLALLGIAALWVQQPPGLRGLAAVVLFLLALWAMRAISLHHTDAALGMRWLGLSLGRWLEGAALAVVFWSVARANFAPGR